MKKLIALITVLSSFSIANAQVRGFGNIDTADLRLTSCDFEKDAKAEVLIDHCIASFTGHVLVLEHHLRLKIFDLSGSSDLGDISIEEPNNGQIRFMSDLQAETVNLNNGKIEITKLDKKSFYKQKIDKWTSKTTFTFPNIKNGSILEYAYNETYNWATHIPDWYFQGDLPVRYSEYDIKVPKSYAFKHKFYFAEHVLTNSDSVVAAANIPSLRREPYMDTYHGNLQRVSFPFANGNNPSDTWQQIGSKYIFGSNYGQQLEIKLKNEEILINAVKDMAPRQKMAYLFKKIRDTLSVDEENIFYDNIGKAWNRKKGSRQQINIILCRLLEQAGIDANLVMVSADGDDRIYPGDPSSRNLDEMLVYVKTGDDVYVLDASDKDAKWNDIPYYALNTYGLYLDVNNHFITLVFIEDKNKARNAVFVNAEILPNGKMTGTAQITNAGYNRIKTLKKYKEAGDKKFSDALRQNDNNLRITSFKIDNMEIDTLPLVQNVEFTYEAPDADGDYLYINPKLFSTLETDPFISKERVSSIDFVYRNNYAISGRYKIPQGYKVDALPKNVSMLMPDSSIRFKQMASEDDGFVNVHWVIDYNKSYFNKDEYPALFVFFRKMFEMLSGQVVLKKT
ncbi:MAG TPA: DUF3857 domain-containing protein [Mucilaginibacter sp.]|nr:DUF3857 domain-containing protein [Mucilaginibacter sp.]